MFTARGKRFVLGRTSLKQETLMRNWKNHKKFNVTKQKQQSSYKLTLMLKDFYWCLYLFLLAALYQGIIGKYLPPSPPPHPPPPLVPNGQYQYNLMEYQAKLNENFMPVLHCTSYKKFFFVLLIYMSFDISIY